MSALGPDQRDEIIALIKNLEQDLAENRSEEHRKNTERRIEYWWKQIANVNK